MTDKAIRPEAAPRRFTIRSERDERANRLCLWLTGEIDAAERGLIVAEMETGEPPKEISIEMSGVTFLGSAGLSALIHASRILEGRDQRVVLVNPTSQVIRLLDTCGLTRQFHIELE